MRSRCCSPPEHCPIGRSRVARRADEVDQLVDPLRRAPRARRPGSGSPKRSPSRPSPTMSTPRIRSDGSKLRVAAGTRSRDSFAAPGRAEHLALARRQRHEPENRLEERRLPDAVRPEDRDELAGATSSSTSRHTASRPPSSTRGAVQSTPRSLAASPSSTRHWRSPRQCPERAKLRTCHAWNVAPAGVERLGHRGHRDVLAPRRVDEPLHVGRRVLAVVDEHLDLVDPRSARRRSPCPVAVGSLPSAIASRKRLGRHQSRPAACGQRRPRCSPTRRWACPRSCRLICRSSGSYSRRFRRSCGVLALLVRRRVRPDRALRDRR